MFLKELASIFRPFTDETETTFIQISPEQGGEDRDIPVRSPAGTKLIKASLGMLLKKSVPTDADARNAADMIEGIAYPKPRRPASLSAEEVIAHRPLAQAVVAVAQRGGTKKSVQKLLIYLNQIAALVGIKTDAGPWPENEDSLGKQLSLLAPMLASVGVRLIRHDTERPRSWSILPIEQEGDRRDGQVAAVNGEAIEASGMPDTSTPPNGHAAEAGGSISEAPEESAALTAAAGADDVPADEIRRLLGDNLV